MLTGVDVGFAALPIAGNLETTKIVVLSLLLCATAHAEDVAFRFVDARGVVHLTDRLGDVPEPYHSMYEAQLRLKKPNAKPPPVSAYQAPIYNFGRGEGARQDKLRQHWQSMVAQARNELAAATEALQHIDEALDQARLNPILRQTPQVKEQIAELEGQRAEALTRLRAAENRLLVELPQQAKKEGVPPKWLL